MIRKLLFALASLTVITSACAAPGAPPTSGALQGLATVESIDILILESFPVQVNAVIKGSLNDSCTSLDSVTQAREGNTLKIKLTTTRPADAVCIQVVSAFEQSVSLEVAGLPAGVYTVDANGVRDTFKLDVDNKLP